MKFITKICLISLLTLLLNQVVQSKKLVMVQSIIRHGARFPGNIKTLKQVRPDISIDQQSEGQLTTNGKKMHYLLGKKMYDQYWGKLFHNTPDMNRYNPSKFYFKSSDFNRTIQSAQSHLMGFFQKLTPLQISQQEVQFSIPPWKGIYSQSGNVFPKAPLFHPTAIHVQKPQLTPGDPRDFLTAYHEKNCPKQRQWRKQNMRDSKIQKITQNQRFKKVIQMLSDQVGKQLSFTNSVEYFDTFECLKYLNMKDKYLNVFKDKENQRTFRTMFNLDLYIRYFYSQKQIKATGTGLFNATINNMQGIVHQRSCQIGNCSKNSNPQYIYYSAHDLTIMNVFAAMNLSNIQCIYDAFDKNLTKDTDRCIAQYPIFASSLIFELYQQQNAKTIEQKYKIKMRFNGNYKKFPFCGYKKTCSLNKFKQFYLNNVQDKNFVENCGINVKENKNLNPKDSGCNKNNRMIHRNRNE